MPNTTILFQKGLVLILGLTMLLVFSNVFVYAFGDHLTSAERKELSALLRQAGIPAECDNTEMVMRGGYLEGTNEGSLVYGIVLKLNDPVSNAQMKIIKRVVNAFLIKNGIAIYTFVALEIRRGNGKIGIIDLR